MNIRCKTLGVMALAVSLSSVAAFAVMHVWVMPSFIDIEQNAVRRSVLRVMNGIQSEIEDLDSIARTFASSDKTYDVAADQYNRFSMAHVSQNIENISADIVSVFDRSGRNIFHGRLKRSAGVVQSMSWNDSSDVPWDQSFLSVDDSVRFVSGVLITEGGALLLAARPISRTSGEGPSAGTVIVARHVTPSLLDELQVRILTDFDLVALDGNTLTSELQAAARELSADNSGIIVTDGRDSSHRGYGLIKDVHGRPAMLISMAPRSEIVSAGRFIVEASIVALLTAGFTIMAITHALLQRLLVAPLRQLTDSVLLVGQGQDLLLPSANGRTDEIAVLGREFGKMLERLAETNRRLLDQSYHAGVSHMATGILHNLRNQMAPATLRLHRVGELALQDGGRPLDRALAEALDPSVDPERRAGLADFLDLAVSELQHNAQTVAEQISIVAEDFARVSTLLDDIDRFSRIGGACEPLALTAVIADAVSLMPAPPDQTVTIEVDAHLKALPRIWGRRFVLKHVLHNVMVNAVESIGRTGRGFGRIEISGRMRTENGTDCVALTIKDDGAGISGDHLMAIFNRGFSTKGSHRHGMGLHWCATGLQAMGGRITAASDGKGQGASLQLVLPIATPLASAAE